jgi:hypothetical protein
VELLLLTAEPQAGSVPPALSGLGHGVRSAATDVSPLLDRDQIQQSEQHSLRSCCGHVVSSNPQVTVMSFGRPLG